MVTDFQADVRGYVDTYKATINSEESKKQKLRIFELQKRLNDIDYKCQQNELRIKMELDEKLRQKRDELEGHF